MKYLSTFTGAAFVALLAFTPSAHAVLINNGVTYTLTEADTASVFTDRFTLTITGINGPADVASPDGGGRSGVNAFAFTEPSGFVTATFIPPPTGFVFVAGGLNSGGCDASGGFFCFDNTLIPNGGGVSALPPYPAGSSLTFVFDVTTATGDFADYDPHLKIDWVGDKTNYDLVSLAVGITPGGGGGGGGQNEVPEPASLIALGTALVGFAVIARRRRRI